MKKTEQQKLTPAQRRTIMEYLDNSRLLFEAVAQIIDGHLSGARRVTSQEIVEALRAYDGLRRWSDPPMHWRTKCIISTAFHAGVYHNFPFELRPGVGFRLKTFIKAKPTKSKMPKVITPTVFLKTKIKATAVEVEKERKRARRMMGELTKKMGVAA